MVCWVRTGFLHSHSAVIIPWLINAFEFLAVGVLTVCIIFLIRRNVLHVKRLWMKELDGWPKSDANYILITEILLMSFFLSMNAADTTLQLRGYGDYAHHLTGNFAFSQWLQPLFVIWSDHSLMILERACWWFHITGIFAFLNYLPYSKHLHILFAFPNAYYGKLESKGKLENMPEIQNEVLYAMQPELAPTDSTGETHKKFGAKDIFDLSWKNLLDAYSCTECGRCTGSLPREYNGKGIKPEIDHDENTRQGRGGWQKYQSDINNLPTIIKRFYTIILHLKSYVPALPARLAWKNAR
jgi:hypothetical protein